MDKIVNTMEKGSYHSFQKAREFLCFACLPPLEYNLSVGLDLVLYSLLYPQCLEQCLLTHREHLTKYLTNQISLLKHQFLGGRNNVSFPHHFIVHSTYGWIIILKYFHNATEKPYPTVNKFLFMHSLYPVPPQSHTLLVLPNVQPSLFVLLKRVCSSTQPLLPKI